MFKTLQERDASLLWHPFTQHQTTTAPIPISRGLGAYLFDAEGKSYLDLISSWWTNIHGHAHPAIAEAISQQAHQLEHVLFASFTHEPAIQLCEQLQKHLPHSLSKFFFSDNGSTAVETALKMAYQYHWNLGDLDRHVFLCFEGGYHGDTFGAMSVGASSGFHNPFLPLFFKTQQIAYPDTWSGDTAIEDKESIAFQEAERYLEQHHLKIAGFILEPLVQGASGMRLCRPEYLNKLCALIRQYNILIIFDEVMTGFYRTGSFFAFEQLNCVPDILCLSKGLSGGFLPLALTISTNKIYEAFLSETAQTALMHGHTYTANPLGCAAALASLALIEEPSLLTKLVALQQAHQQGLSLLASTHPKLSKHRLLGTLAAFSTPEPLSTDLFLKQGLLIRPLGCCVYLMPPYCIEPEELKKAYETMAHLLTTS